MTSTSTPASMFMIICLTTSVGDLRLFKVRYVRAILRQKKIVLGVSSYVLDQPLVDPHLEQIPRLAPLTTGCLPRADLQRLRRKTHRTFDRQILGLGTLDQFRADLLKRCDFARGEGDANLMDFLRDG